MDKLTTRINYMLDHEHDDFFANITINPAIENILFDYQLLHLCNLISAFRTNNVLLDGSDTGTGKTYTSIALCKQLNLSPIIVCPKIMINEWGRVSALFGVNPLLIINYESAKTINNKFITQTTTNKKVEYSWYIPNKYNAIVIFDEAHRCKNPSTQNHQLLLGTKSLRKVLMLSATLTDKPHEFVIFGYMLNLYNNLKKGHGWVKSRLYEDSITINQSLSSICSKIYPDKGSRMQISELKDKFPENKVMALAYGIGDDYKTKIAKYVHDVKTSPDYQKVKGDDLKIFTKLRQYIEFVKVSIIHDLILDHLENDFSIVVFLNYNANINKLAELCNTNCIVNGEIDIKDREQNIKDFQAGIQPLIICNTSVESISLHHINGGKRRVSLISPNFSSTSLIQTLGRIYRTGSQSACLQKIIFCSGTFEEEMCNKIKKKLEFVEKLNSNELMEIENF